MAGYVAEAQALRGEGNIINVNVLHGFFASDIEETCLSVVAVTDGDLEKAQEICDGFAARIWEDRANLRRSFWDIDKAIDDALEKGEFPVVFADISDNPGSGATGDGTHMLRRLLERKTEGVAAVIIYDPGDGRAGGRKRRGDQGPDPSGGKDLSGNCRRPHCMHSVCAGDHRRPFHQPGL